MTNEAAIIAYYSLLAPFFVSAVISRSLMVHRLGQRSPLESGDAATLGGWRRKECSQPGRSKRLVT